MRLDCRDTPSTGYRVLLDGIEVTDQCFLADDQTGEVGLYLRDDSGHFYRDPATRLEAAQEIRHGRVVIFGDGNTLRQTRRRSPSLHAKELIA